MRPMRFCGQWPKAVFFNLTGRGQEEKAPLWAGFLLIFIHKKQKNKSSYSRGISRFSLGWRLVCRDRSPCRLKSCVIRHWNKTANWISHYYPPSRLYTCFLTDPFMDTGASSTHAGTNDTQNVKCGGASSMTHSIQPTETQKKVMFMLHKPLSKGGEESFSNRLFCNLLFTDMVMLLTGHQSPAM